MSGSASMTSTPPPIKLWSPAVDFIENRMWQYHPAYNAQNFNYDPLQGQFVAVAPNSRTSASSSLATLNVQGSVQPRPAPEVVNDMNFWNEVLPRAISELNKTEAPKHGHQSQWGIRHCSNWPDIQAKLDMARRDYDHMHEPQHVGRFRNKVRDVLDKTTVPIQQVVKGIPSTDITSPIVSVSNVLLDAYRQAMEVRDSVTSGFDDLPGFFATADFYFGNYPDDQNILRASVNFLLATLKAVEEAIMFYTSKQAKRAGLAVLTGDQYQQKLSRCLLEMKSYAEDLVNQARMSLHHHVVSESEQTRISHTAIRQDNWLSHQALGALLQEERVGRSERAWIGHMLNATLGLLLEQSNNWPPRSPIPSRATTPMLIEAQTWTPRDLWLRLHIPNVDEIDLQKALNSASDIIFSDRGRAQQVIQTRHLRDWMLSSSSAKLLIHGDFDDIGKTSPLSILIATVSQGFRTAPGVLSLVFFCGYHLWKDEHHGGSAMIRSLLAQLLRQFPFSNINPPADAIPHDIENAGIDQLCKLFTYLVRQLPPRTTVFCLIDGINEYEREEYIHGMDEVVFSLLGLVDEGSRARFKLLLTSPRPTVEVRKAFDQEDGALLHMQQLPVVEECVESDRIWNRAGYGFEGET